MNLSEATQTIKSRCGCIDLYTNEQILCYRKLRRIFIALEDVKEVKKVQYMLTLTINVFFTELYPL